MKSHFFSFFCIVIINSERKKKLNVVYKKRLYHAQPMRMRKTFQYCIFLLQQRNLLKKGGFTDFGFGEFSYDKFFKYFELLSQQHENELTGLRRQLELLEADQKIAQVCLFFFSCKNCMV